MDCNGPRDCDARRRPRHASSLLVGLFLLTAPVACAAEPAIPRIAPALELHNGRARDQDDLAVWSRPDQLPLSTVIASDKSAGRLFVYDLQGALLQELAVTAPGNVDLRHGFPLGDRQVSIVAVNQREQDERLRVFAVDPQTRLLSPVDDDIRLGENYGGCLYHSRRSGRFYFISTTKSGRISQYELADNGRGGITGSLVRTWQLAQSEGAVADDELGYLYVGEEARGVWKLGAEPDDPTPGRLIVRVGMEGVRGDIEGLALLKHNDATGYLLISDQGADRFLVYERQGENRRTGAFAVAGANGTDGIEAIHGDFGGPFRGGIFGCHTDARHRPILLVGWDDIRRKLMSD